MAGQNFDSIIDALMLEYENSGMSMDDFIKAMLKASARPVEEQSVADIISIIDGIYAAFTRFPKFKAEGNNREEWLRKEMDDTLKDVPHEEGRKQLISAINWLNSMPDASADYTPEYSGFDAPFLIREQDDAHVKNSCENLSEEEK